MSINILVLNARSLKKPNAVTLLQLDLINQNIAICCVSETWLTTEISDDFVGIANYHVIRHDRSNINSTKCSGGGVCVFLHKSVTYDFLQPSNYENFEIIWLLLNLGTTKCLLVCVYYPPNVSYGAALTEHITASIEELYPTINPHHAIACDDFNQLDWSTLSENCNLTSVHNASTRGNKQLDFLLCTDATIFQTCANIKCSIDSDHMAILGSMVFSTKQKPETREPV